MKIHSVGANDGSDKVITAPFDGDATEMRATTSVRNKV